jgi:hypothetical protein
MREAKESVGEEIEAAVGPRFEDSTIAVQRKTQLSVKLRYSNVF